MIRTERIYSVNKGDGLRVLVDRLWPRGIAKEKAKLDLWMKDIAPSDDLRRWFGHDPEKWGSFRERYFKELDAKQELVDQLIVKVREGNVVLLFGARDELHNNAVALKEYIEKRIYRREG